GVLAKTTVLQIVHDAGEQLKAAAHARAATVYARDPEALRLLLPPTPEEEQRVAPGDPDADADLAAEAATPALIGFAGGPTDPPEVSRDEPRAVDTDVVLVELDEVKVHAQADTTRKQVQALTAVVMIAGRCWHLAAATMQELAYQVGAL